MVEGTLAGSDHRNADCHRAGAATGPATGLPTKTEQADLNFALYSAHGEFPRVLLAPGTPEQAFFLTNKAFDLAEMYQIPVIILSDQYLADTQWTFDDFDTARLIYRDYRLAARILPKLLRISAMRIPKPVSPRWRCR